MPLLEGKVFNTIQLSWFQECDLRTCLAESPDRDGQTEWVSSLFEKVEVSFLVSDFTMAWNSLMGCFLHENIYLGWNVPPKLIQRTIGNFVCLVNVQIFEAGEMQGSQTHK